MNTLSHPVRIPIIFTLRIKFFQASAIKYWTAEKANLTVHSIPSLEADMRLKDTECFPQLFIWYSKDNVTKSICFLSPGDFKCWPKNCAGPLMTPDFLTCSSSETC